MKKTLKIIGIILFLMGAPLFFAGIKFVIPAFSEPVDIMEEGMGAAIPDKAVATDLSYVYERFSRQDNRDYHVIPVWSGDSVYYIPISILSKNAGNYSQVVKETMNYGYGTESAHFEGIVVELDTEISWKMKDWFRDNGVSSLNDHTLPYMLYQVDLEGQRVNAIVFGTLMLVGLVLLGIGFLAPSRVKVTLELKETKINGMTYPILRLRALNNLIMKGKKQEAQDILMKDFHVEYGYAAFVVDNWSEYYY